MRALALLTCLAASGCIEEARAANAGSGQIGNGAIGGQFGGGFTVPSGGETITDLYSRQFSSPTKALPTCSAATACEMQCTVVGSNWTCVDETGASIGVTQGSGVVTLADAFGMTSLDEVTDTRAPRLTSSFDAVLAGAFTIVVTGYGSARDSSFGHVFGVYAGVGSSLTMRQEGNSFKIYPNTYEASISSLGTLFGWGMVSARSNSANTTWTIRASRSETADSTGAWTDPTSTTWRFGHHSSAGNALRGPLQHVTVFSEEKSAAQLLSMETAWAGVPDDSDNPLTYTRAGQRFAVVSGRATPFGQHTPYVSSRGLEIGTGSEGNVAGGSGWAAESTIASGWTAIGTPTTTDNVAAGPFADWKLGNGGTEGDLIVDDDAGAFEGYSGTAACGDAENITGYYTASCWVRSGTSGTTTDQVSIGVVTNGTGTTDCEFTGLTTTWQRVECTANVTGSPTSIRGRIRVGDAAADTGSIIVSHCQCDAEAFPVGERPDAITSGFDAYAIPATEEQTWPTGETVGGEAEVVFALDHDHPSEGQTYEYPFDTLNGDGLDHWLAITVSYADKVTPSKIRVALRPDNSVPTIGDQTDTDTFSDDIAELEAGQFYVARFRYMPAGESGGYARVKHYIYFDECADVATCTATTLIGSDTTGTKFAAIDARGGGAVLGIRSYGNVGHMDGAVARLRVSEVQ